MLAVPILVLTAHLFMQLTPITVLHEDSGLYDVNTNMLEYVGNALDDEECTVMTEDMADFLQSIVD
jgi:hypothetical protein